MKTYKEGQILRVIQGRKGTFDIKVERQTGDIVEGTIVEGIAHYYGQDNKTPGDYIKIDTSHPVIQIIEF